MTVDYIRIIDFLCHYVLSVICCVIYVLSNKATLVSFCLPHSPFEFITIFCVVFVLFSINNDSATYLWRLYRCVPSIVVVMFGDIPLWTLNICFARAFDISALFTELMCSPSLLWRLQPVVPVYIVYVPGIAVLQILHCIWYTHLLRVQSVLLSALHVFGNGQTLLENGSGFLSPDITLSPDSSITRVSPPPGPGLEPIRSWILSLSVDPGVHCTVSVHVLPPLRNHVFGDCPNFESFWCLMSSPLHCQ